MAPASVPESCTALATMVESTVSRSSVEFTAWDTSYAARAVSRPSGRVHRCAGAVRRVAAILDRDHCLVGEGLDQLDLLVGEGPHGFALKDQDSDGRPSRRSGTPSMVCYAAKLLPRASFRSPDRRKHRECESARPSDSGRQPSRALPEWMARHIGSAVLANGHTIATCR